MKRAVVSLILALTLITLPLSGLAEPAEADLDLSVMPASVAFAQAVNLLREPEAYLGQTLRIAGAFNYSPARERGVVIIADTSGCCETSMDFICADALAYPEDYPPLYGRFVVSGRFEASESEEGVYLLTDAVIEEY